MVSFTIFKAASILALLSSFVSAAPAASSDSKACANFRITSPTTYFTTTAGQCYQVSYDFGDITPSSSSWISVDLYDNNTKKLAHSVVKKASTTQNYTPWFNIDLGSSTKSGDYYFLVTYGPNCKSVKSSTFHVTYNKNSGPATCPSN